MDAPDVREAGRIQPLAAVRLRSEHLRGLVEIVLEDVRLGERGADLRALVAGQTGLLEGPGEGVRRFSTSSLLEGFDAFRVEVSRHAAEYTLYTLGCLFPPNPPGNSLSSG